jgi:6-pyruvoyltetrahydropterin/6-carboxytetrahydropterin synthase
MYSLAIQRKFAARHFLVGGDWGTENCPHAHQYRLEVEVSGPDLDSHGYLVDIVDMEMRLEKILGTYEDKLLNEQPSFAGLNPSIEHFARIITDDFLRQGVLSNISAIRVMIWENDQAWASYSREFQ